MAQQKGIRADEVIRDPRADAFLFLLDLNPSLDAEGAQAFLKRLTEAKRALEAPLPRIGKVATSVVALGPSFFVADGSPRFGLEGKMPADFAHLPEVPGLQDPVAGQHDVLIYVMSTSEAAVADFERALGDTGALSLGALERGFQRRDRREMFGFRDGIRNVPTSQRHRVIRPPTPAMPD